MPITGQETTLESLLITQIETAITISTGSAPVDPNNIADIAKGISIAIISFLVTNITIMPGIPVVTVGGPTTQTGATTGPGVIT